MENLGSKVGEVSGLLETHGRDAARIGTQLGVRRENAVDISPNLDTGSLQSGAHD